MKVNFNEAATKTFNAATSQTALGLYLIAAVAAVAAFPPAIFVVGECLLGAGALFGIRVAVDYKKNKAAEKNAPSA